MSLFYPMQNFGPFGLSYGLTPSLLHARYGLDFGERGAGFARLNFATTRPILDAILDRVFEALGS